MAKKPSHLSSDCSLSVPFHHALSHRLSRPGISVLSFWPWPPSWPARLMHLKSACPSLRHTFLAPTCPQGPTCSWPHLPESLGNRAQLARPSPAALITSSWCSFLSLRSSNNSSWVLCSLPCPLSTSSRRPRIWASRSCRRSCSIWFWSQMSEMRQRLGHGAAWASLRELQLLLTSACRLSSLALSSAPARA